MQSVMTHQFSQVPRADIPRSTFDRSHGVKTAFNAGWLIPIFVDEALPGDTFHLTAQSFGRLATPLHPIMDNMMLDYFFFAVPIRLVWANFKKFFGEQENPGDSTSFLVPTITAPAVTGFPYNSIYDYMGIPPGVPNLTVNALHLRANNLIYNQWFRDQNLQASFPVPTGDGPDAWDIYFLERRGKRHDYFTSALPWPQKGPAVTIPIGSQAAIKTNATATVTGAQLAMKMSTEAGANPTGNTLAAVGSTGFFGNTASPGTISQGLYPNNLYADLSTATATTINQLRQAFQVQRIYERDARGGTRYTELIQSHFGVTSPDARLQRAEYLGGGRADLNVNPIAQTSNVEGAPAPLGNLAAMGTVVNRGVGFSKSFTEHCLLLGYVSARADLNYQEGLNRMWSRQTRFDFFWPALAHIGEQSILNKEIYATGVPATDDLTFGYQERFAEYRYKPSVITGYFRSNYTESLDTWHLAQNFETTPVLNSSFIKEDPPVQRIIATPDDPHFLLDTYFRLKCARPMPMYGVPGNIDRF